MSIVSPNDVVSSYSCSCIYHPASEDESASSSTTGEQSAKYETVELKITTCDNKRIVEMKLRNMSNPELSVEGACRGCSLD